jgi:hypothetical protein
MTGAEVMTTAIVAALYFGGNLEKARKMLQAYHSGFIEFSDLMDPHRCSAKADLFSGLGCWQTGIIHNNLNPSGSLR